MKSIKERGWNYKSIDIFGLRATVQLPPIDELIKHHFDPQDNIEEYAEFIFKEILNQKSCKELENIVQFFKYNVEPKKIDREVLKDILWKNYPVHRSIMAYCN